MIVTIFKSLGVDQTVFFQIISLVIIFFIVSNLLFNKLKEVLELRENRTVKLENVAHAVYKKADELSEQYSARIEKSHQESHLNNQSKKNEILKKERDLILEAEKKLDAEFELKKSEFNLEHEAKRGKALSEVNELSKNLIDKLTK